MIPECETLKDKYGQIMNGLFSGIPFEYHRDLYRGFKRIERGINERGYKPDEFEQSGSEIVSDLPPRYQIIVLDILPYIAYMAEKCDCQSLNFHLSEFVVER